MVREAIPHKTQFTTFDILLDGVERLLLGNFHLGVCPPWNLDDHVQNAIVPVGKERDVVKRRDNISIRLDENAVFWKKAT